LSHYHENNNYIHGHPSAFYKGYSKLVYDRCCIRLCVLLLTSVWHSKMAEAPLLIGYPINSRKYVLK